MQGLHCVALEAMSHQLIQPALIVVMLGAAYLIFWRLTPSTARHGPKTLGLPGWRDLRKSPLLPVPVATDSVKTSSSTEIPNSPEVLRNFSSSGRLGMGA